MGLPLTPEQRTLRARAAVLASHINEDPRERTAAASRATPTQLPHWQAKVRAEHPDLPDAEMARRADLLHRQYMTALSYKSSRARQARAADRAAKAG